MGGRGREVVIEAMSNWPHGIPEGVYKAVVFSAWPQPPTQVYCVVDVCACALFP